MKPINPINPKSATLVDLFARLDDEAFSWLVLACLPSAAMRGAGVQIWPDGLGGFKDRETIEAIRREAERYVRGD